MDFDGSVNTVATETEKSEDDKLKNSVLISIGLSVLASRGVEDTKEQQNEMYKYFTEFLGATGYTVVKKEI